MRDIQDLSDWEIARLLLRIEAKIHDGGGISHGRSIQSVYLRAVIGVIPNTPLSYRYPAGEVFEEAQRRNRKRTNERLRKHFQRLNERIER